MIKIKEWYLKSDTKTKVAVIVLPILAIISGGVILYKSFKPQPEKAYYPKAIMAKEIDFEIGGDLSLKDFTSLESKLKEENPDMSSDDIRKKVFQERVSFLNSTNGIKTALSSSKNPNPNKPELPNPEDYYFTEKESVEVVDPIDIENVDDEQLWVGESVVKNKGEQGKKRITTITVYTDDTKKEVVETREEEEIIIQKQNKVIANGTRYGYSEHESKMAFELLRSARSSDGKKTVIWSNDYYKVAMDIAKDSLDGTETINKDKYDYKIVKSNVDSDGLMEMITSSPDLKNIYINDESFIQSSFAMYHNKDGERIWVFIKGEKDIDQPEPEEKPVEKPDGGETN